MLLLYYFHDCISLHANLHDHFIKLMQNHKSLMPEKIKSIEIIIHRFPLRAYQKIETKYEAHMISDYKSRLPGGSVSWCDFRSWMMLN